MREFFKGWRRKAGVVTLLTACIFTIAWLKSLATLDSLYFRDADDRDSYAVSSVDGFLVLCRHSGCVVRSMIPRWESRKQVTFEEVWIDTAFTTREYWNRTLIVGVTPCSGGGYFTAVWYGVIVIPLTLCSCCLLCSKQPPRNSPTDPPKDQP